MKQDCALIVFAKAPVPGYAKTRLAHVLGAEAAARLASRMLAETLATAIEAGIGPVELCCAPHDTHPEFRRAAIEYGVNLTLQGDGDLGTRMNRALTRSLNVHRRVLLIGTDASGLGAVQLRDAAVALYTQAAVFVPRPMAAMCWWGYRSRCRHCSKISPGAPARDRAIGGHPR